MGKKIETKEFSKYVNGLKNLPEPWSCHGKLYYKLPQKLHIDLTFEQQQTIVNKISIRRSRKLSGNKTILDVLRIKADRIAHNIPSDGYSMGSTYTVRIVSNNGKVLFEGRDNREQEYASSCHYRANHGSVYLELSPAEFRSIKIIGGLVTKINTRRIDKRTYKCTWLEMWGNKQYAHLVWRSGYVCNGFHSVDKKAAAIGGKKLEECRKAEEKEKKQQLILQKIEQKKIKLSMRRVFCFDDSIKAGNCRPGTEAFCRYIGVDVTARIKGEELVGKCREKCPQLMPFLERVLKH